MKKILVIVICLISFKSISQELVKTLPLKFAKNTDVFQVVEEDKKQTLLFFSDKKNVRTIRLNETFDITDSITTNRPDKQYDDIVGYSTSNNSYFTYWMGSNNKEILAQNFNFETHSTVNKLLTIDFEKEKTIKRITVNNIFYIINIVKNTSILNLYVFKEGTIEKKSIDLTEKTFLDSENKKATLWKVLNTSTGFEPPLFIQNISNDSPPSLTFSANKRKVYTAENSLIFTIDSNPNFTQTITVDLSNFSFLTKAHATPLLVGTEYDVNNSNSFIINDRIIQTKIISTKMIICIKDFFGTEIKRLEMEVDNEIPFKNSEIIQENGSIKNTRILDKSNQLIRKIYNLNPSLSGYFDNNIIYLTIGGVSLIQNNNAAMYGAMFGMAGVLIAAAISSNYSMQNLNSYKNRKVVYINCMFDTKFDHISGVAKKFAFDKLREFEESNADLSVKTVFKSNKVLFFGGANTKTNEYKIYKFQD